MIKPNANEDGADIGGERVKLTPGDDLDFVGVVETRQVLRPQSGAPPFVRATVAIDDTERVLVVWWDAGRAPDPGARVRIQGRVRQQNGGLEVHALAWSVERTAPPDDPIAQIIGFYIGCVEAEASGSVRVRPGSSGHVELTSGPSPVHGGRPLPANDAVGRWAGQRQMAIGESVIAGWPMVVGADDAGGALVASPLLTSDIRLLHQDAGWAIEPDGGGVDLNPYALDLLGVGREERDTVVRLVEATPSVEEARLPEDRAAAILAALRDAGIAGLDHLDPSQLAPNDGTAGIHNTGMLIVATGSTQITRMLLQDLEELLNDPGLVSSGPAAVMLGRAPAPTAALPKPFPCLVPSTLTQDQAVASAMENVLTVVTGPPGTGKSQVLVNVVAAAVTRGETVLFASKNNQAVDVVFDRLEMTSTDPCIVRAGASSRRAEVASSLAKMLAIPPRTIDPAARREWADIEARVQSIHDVPLHRAQIERDLDGLKRGLSDRLDALPRNLSTDIDTARLDAATETARASLEAFGHRLGVSRRWTRHRQRLGQARQELSALGELLGLDRNAVDLPLRSVSDRPKRSLTPRHDFGTIEDIVNAVRWVKEARATIQGKREELDALPSKQTLDDQLHDINAERNATGRALLDIRWEQTRRDDPAARKAAGHLAEALKAITDTGMGARKARGLVASALPAVPVWGVTNLSARTNLPLDPELFDLVVIDEASQCDVASALPLLARARRALIIGDRRQLIHITSLSQARERSLGRRWGLDDDRLDEFSYRKRSCFGLASSRVDESPIFLDLHFRSHPAIIGFSNEHFYDGRLELCSDSRPPNHLPAIEWIRVPSDSERAPQGRSRVNRQEAQALAAALGRDISELIGLGLTVGVVTPYRAQSELIRDHLLQTLGEDMARRVTVATAHRFQGDERDVMYFSPVVGTSMTERQAAFAADPNLVNVALTRARRRFVIVGNLEACLSHHNVLRSLANYVSRLEAGGFDSPLEQAFHEALLDRGVAAETGVIVAGHRLDLAIRQGNSRLDLECDGAAFHMDRNKDAVRDRDIEAAGWKVLRFSGRRISTDLAGCVDDVLAVLP